MKTQPIRFMCRLLLGSWLLAACQPTTTDVQPDPAAPAQGIPTEIGKPVGSPIQKTIGPAGGSMTTPDNTLTLVIPPGALKKDTLITVQPVENKAPGGTGLSYELSPKNLELAKPAELVWNYHDKDVQGSAPEALGLAIQQPDRTWLGRRNVTLNKASRKVSASVWMLQRAAWFEMYFMKPTEASIAPGETQQLDVYFQSEHRDSYGDTPNEAVPVPLVEPHLLQAWQIEKWQVNGQDLGNRADSQLGSLSVQGERSTAVYMAPNRVPKQNQIAVSVEITLGAKILLVTNLTIEGANSFKINGVSVDSAEVMSIAFQPGQFLQLALAEGLTKGDKQALVALTIKQNFVGTGTYSASGSDDSQLYINGQDRNRKKWSSDYYPRNGKKVVGPLTVKITEYDALKKRVSGSFSGTLHHYDERTDKHETAPVSAKFRAVSL